MNTINIPSANTILFLNQYPTGSDGYQVRVMSIDKVFSNYVRYYLNQHGTSSSIDKISDMVYQINIPERHDDSILNTLFIMFPNVYAHSILTLRSDLKSKVFANAKLSILDVHGVVPEECQLMKCSLRTINEVSNVEKFAINHAKCIITVTEAMRHHLEQKYHTHLHQKTIVLPIIPQDTKPPHKSYNEVRPTIIYTGGSQIWQQVDKMLKFVNIHKTKFEFIFLIDNSAQIHQKYIKLFQEKFPGIITTVSQDLIWQYYQQAHYGLILREDIIVNKVSCPTKLIEYMSHGIIPIIDSYDIGDFYKLNYKYINYNDETKLNSATYQEYVKFNYLLVNSLQQQCLLNQQVLCNYTDNTYTISQQELYQVLLNNLFTICSHKQSNVAFVQQALKALLNKFKYYARVIMHSINSA
jgi:hypothetical protein